MSISSAYPERRRGISAVVVLFTLPLILGFAALSIDVGYLYNVQNELQTSADAAALAAVSQLPASGVVTGVAQQFASLNSPGNGPVLAPGDVTVGHWEASTAVFSMGGYPINAVRVTTRRSQTQGNPVDLFFSPIFGIHHTDVSATATALVGENCFDRGLLAGRFVTVADEFEYEDVNGTYCVYGRQGMTINELELEDGTLTLGALDPATIQINSMDGGPPQIVPVNLQPIHAQRADQLIDGIESGALVQPGTPVVVMSGPVNLLPGDLQPNTAYVINGDATFPQNVILQDVTLAVRGSINFVQEVQMFSTPPAPGDLPLTIVATGDITFNYEVKHISGARLVAGQDVVFVDEVELEHLGPNALGMAVEAGRDIVFQDELEFEHLNLNFTIPFGGTTAHLLVQ